MKETISTFEDCRAVLARINRFKKWNGELITKYDLKVTVGVTFAASKSYVGLVLHHAS